MFLKFSQALSFFFRTHIFLVLTLVDSIKDLLSRVWVILAVDLGFGFVASGKKRGANARDGFLNNLRAISRNFDQIYLKETVSF